MICERRSLNSINIDWRFDRFSGSNRFYRQNMKRDGCNLDIMPPRKKQNKRSNKLNLKKRTLSKSQRLKLKRLEEDREKELLSAKNSDLLNKYKIYEDVSSLLQSSKVIGRSDTKLEKCRRPML